MVGEPYTKARPLLYYDGPEGKWLNSARILCNKLQKTTWSEQVDSRDIIDILDDRCDNPLQTKGVVYHTYYQGTTRGYPASTMVILGKVSRKVVPWSSLVLA